MIWFISRVQISSLGYTIYRNNLKHLINANYCERYLSTTSFMQNNYNDKKVYTKFSAHDAFLD